MSARGDACGAYVNLEVARMHDTTNTTPSASVRTICGTTAVLALFCLGTILPSVALGQGRTTTIAISGQAAPGAGGGTFDSIGAPMLNDLGQTVFYADVGGSISTKGIFRSESAGTITAVARERQSAPGAGGGTFGSFMTLPVLNASGQTAFSASVVGGTSSQGIFRSTSGTTLTAIALQGQTAPGIAGGTFGGFFAPAMNASGRTVFYATASGTSTRGIFVDGTSAIARLGQSAPGAGGGTFTSFEPDPAINANGQVTVNAGISGGTYGQGIFRSEIFTNALITIARQGQSAPGPGGGTFSFLDSPVINASGQMAFIADVTGGTNSVGIFRSDAGSVLTAIARQGQIAPGTGGGTFGGYFGFEPRINASGQTGFYASVAGSASSVGIFRSDSAGALTAIALRGQSAPGAGTGTFASFVFDSVLLNDGGQMAFDAGINGGTSSSGLYLGDGREAVAVQLLGASLAGKTVSYAFLPPSGLNNSGQLAYGVSFTDGSSGAFLFTPALRWRESFSSGWGGGSNWTLGIAPGSVHDVTIDPAATLTVFGPTVAVNVRSLVVGSGTGFVTLALSGGSIGATNGVQMASRGILSGSGSITSQVVNGGEVRADNLILSGGLVNNGIVRGAATGNQRIDTNLANAAAGVVRVDGGERLRLVGTSHTNAGTIDLNGGELQVTGTLTNNAGARILLNDGRLQTLSGLTNNGQLQVTFGESVIFGSIITNSGGKLILSGNSNTTFYDLIDVKSSGELRVSTGSTAVFFGQVLQRTGSLFTGTGTKFYEGGLAIGGSPGLAVDTGDVNLGAGNVFTVDIGGITACTAACDGDDALRNSSFDKYIVAGHLAMGGTLQLSSWNGFVLEAGQSFDLLDWGSVSGSFDHIDASGLLLAAGLRLDTSRLGLDGSIAITAVPEPQTWALMLTGLALAGLRRRGRYTSTPGVCLMRRSEQV
jgi:hypothetical protein